MVRVQVGRASQSILHQNIEWIEVQSVSVGSENALRVKRVTYTRTATAKLDKAKSTKGSGLSQWRIKCSMLSSRSTTTWN